MRRFRRGDVVQIIKARDDRVQGALMIVSDPGEDKLIGFIHNVKLKGESSNQTYYKAEYNEIYYVGHVLLMLEHATPEL